MLYKYIHKKPYRYYDVLVAESNDILEITDDRIVNQQRGVDLSNGTHGIIQDILKRCEQYEAPVTSGMLPPPNVDPTGLDDETDAIITLRIPWEEYDKLKKLGIIESEVRKSNFGASNYAQHVIQPWSIWMDYQLNPWDADIVKRVLRTKKESDLSEKEARLLDYNKIIHICQERIRQLENS